MKFELTEVGTLVARTTYGVYIVNEDDMTGGVLLDFSIDFLGTIVPVWEGVCYDSIKEALTACQDADRDYHCQVSGRRLNSHG